MNTTIEKYVLYALKAVAVFSIFIALLRITFDSDGSYYGLLFGLLSGGIGIYYVIFSALILTNSKGIINFGAFASMLIALIVIGNTIFTILKGNDLDSYYVNGWTTIQYFTQVLVGVVSGLYIAIESGKRLLILERIIFVAVIPVFMIVELMSPTDGTGVFEGWGWEAVFSVAFVTVIMLAVLFFSNLLHTIAFPLMFGLLAWVNDISNVKHYIFDNKDAPSTLDYYDVSDYYQDFNAVTLLRALVSTAFVIGCGYIVWRTRKNEQVVTV